MLAIARAEVSRRVKDDQESAINLLGHAGRKIAECIALSLGTDVEEVCQQADVPLLMTSSIKELSPSILIPNKASLLGSHGSVPKFQDHVAPWARITTNNVPIIAAADISKGNKNKPHPLHQDKMQNKNNGDSPERLQASVKANAACFLSPVGTK